MKLNSTLITITLIFISFSCFAQYQIGHKSFDFIDASRNDRSVYGEVYYPADVTGDEVAMSAGQYPVIVFGHGFTINWSEYSVWWEELVADGYIVAFPRTEGNLFSTNHTRFAQDLAFLIDAFNAESTDASSFYFNTMTGKNAIMGHSMGGGCSYVAAGNYGANVETIITMAAAETSESAIGAAANITFPVLTLAGSADCVVMNNEAPIDIYNGLTSTSYKAYVEITGASHCQFGIASSGSICTLGELCSGFMPKADQHIQMFLSAHPWLDFYLKDECDRWTDFKANLTTSTAHTYLESGALSVPTVNVSSTNSSICAGNSTMLTAVVNNGVACSTQWNLNGSPISGATGLTLSATMTGTYMYEVINADGAMSSESISLIVNPSPTPSIIGATSICIGATTVLDAGTGFASYLWSDGSTNQTLSVTTAGTYTVAVTNANGCEGTTSSSVTINTPAALSITGILNICAGTNTNLTASPGFLSYLWSDGSTASSLVVNTSGNYTVIGTDANGCTSMDIVTVNVSAPIIPSISGANDFCDGSSSTLDAGSGYASYLWSDGSTNQTLSTNVTGTFNVTVTDANGCLGMTSVSVTEYAPVSVSISGSTSICSGSTTILDGGTGFSSYLWSDGSTNQTLAVSSGGTYGITATDSNGCTATDMITVTVSSALTPSISGANDFCDGSSSTLDAGSGYASYLWSDGSTNQTLSVTVGGTYTITVTDANGCAGTASAVVTEYDPISVVISGDAAFCSGLNSTLDAGMGFSSYLWSDGSTNQTLTVTVGGSYEVTITDANGCSASNSFMVTENAIPSVSFTQTGNILTANGMGGSTFTYQWYYNMNPISGATASTYDSGLSGSGDYYVEMTNEFGCMTTSSTMNIVTTSNHNIASLGNFEIYPTLANNDIQIVLESQEGFDGQMMIYDMSGKQIFSQSIQFIGNDVILIFINDYPQGSYLLSIRNKEGIMTKKFIKI